MKNRVPEQVLRIDGKNAFLEVMISGAPIDKVYINFLDYDKRAEKGSRKKDSIGIYLDMFEAQVLARDIMSGLLAKLAMNERDRVKRENRRYAEAVYKKQGGTPAAKNNGAAIARIFEIVPGSSQPWVFTAKQGKAHETPEGLIVMDGLPEVTIRVPATNQKIKEFAMAIEAVVSVWAQLRFAPVIASSMAEAREQRSQWDQRGQGNPQGQVDQRGQWDQRGPWNQRGQGDPRNQWDQRNQGSPQGQGDQRGPWNQRGQGDPRNQWDQRSQGSPQGQGDQRGSWDQRGQGDPRS